MEIILKVMSLLWIISVNIKKGGRIIERNNKKIRKIYRR